MSLCDSQLAEAAENKIKDEGTGNPQKKPPHGCSVADHVVPPQAEANAPLAEDGRSVSEREITFEPDEWSDWSDRWSKSNTSERYFYRTYYFPPRRVETNLEEPVPEDVGGRSDSAKVLKRIPYHFDDSLLDESGCSSEYSTASVVSTPTLSDTFADVVDSSQSKEVLVSSGSGRTIVCLEQVDIPPRENERSSRGFWRRTKKETRSGSNKRPFFALWFSARK